MSKNKRGHPYLSRLPNEEDLFLDYFEDDNLDLKVYNEGYLKRLVAEKDIVEINELLG